ncbi:hypothetical protein SAMN04488243_10318 [Thermus arciformis]|uniref:Uncharacterized protein n=1 Tax=Thermus arciformis TaxID=482827 RepID=A0A1G7DJY1_9DEIN|nr:hypothetical protein [Thermus arciformis]SDE51854.1 hypothetical protein SAMN04488243_10318 [Thermus arciformis]
MRGLSGFLALLSLALAQTVSLPKPEGPVVEVVASNVNATFKIQGCARDQEGKVVCAVQIQSNARTNQQLTVLHQSVRAISARGFSYPGYLSVEGGQVEASRSVFALPAGNQASGKLIFPQVPREETFFAAIYMGGLEFRGIPVGQAAVPSPAPAQAPSQAQAAQEAEPWKRFAVGPFTFELVGEPYFECCYKVTLIYNVVSSQDARLQMRFNNTRTILEGGFQRTGGEFAVSGGLSDFLAGIPLRVYVHLYVPDVNASKVLYTEFEVFDGKGWQKIVFRNMPFKR